MQIDVETMNTRRWKKYFAKSIRSIRICVTRLLSALIMFLCSFKRFLKHRDDNVTQILRSLFAQHSFQTFSHFLCSIFLNFLFVDMCSLKVVALVFAQRLLNQKRSRSLDVEFARRRRRFLDCVNLRLILSQWLMINVSCDFFLKMHSCFDLQIC